MSQVAEPAIVQAAKPETRWIDLLERASDRLSPILVKEVRQIVKGRDFSYAFVISLVAGMGVAFFGAADAITGSAAGGWTFTALTTCLAFLGFAVVPLGAFNALRNERLEQTFDLIALTALSPRKIIIGKLLAQAVKLTTMFAAMGPFVAMSFLLGGIDFVTVVIALVTVFAWSIWVCAASIFVSAIPKTRAMSGFVFATLGVGLLALFFFTRAIYNSLFFSPFGPLSAGLGPGPVRVNLWWIVALVLTTCGATMLNLVLLAENRLTSPTDDRSTALRAGFLLQFCLAIAWALSWLGEPSPAPANAGEALITYGAIHLAIVAAFTVTEDVQLSRRVQLRLAAAPRWRRWIGILRPGGRWGVPYIVFQMALLFGATALLLPRASAFRWLLAACGFIALFTGLPTALLRRWRPSTPSWILRVVILFVFAAALVLPDIIYFLVWQPEVFNLRYTARHLLNPVRTLAEWRAVTAQHWDGIAVAVSVAGLLAYIDLMRMRGARADGSAPASELSVLSINGPVNGREGDGGVRN